MAKMNGYVNLQFVEWLTGWLTNWLDDRLVVTGYCEKQNKGVKRPHWLVRNFMYELQTLHKSDEI